LETIWRQDVDSGDVVGPYWAMMTHPRISDELTSQVFGEIHMLSHLVGASVRVDMKRLKQLEQALDKVKAESRVRMLSSVKKAEKQEDRVRKLKQQLKQKTQELNSIRGAEKRARELENGSEFARLRSSLHKSRLESQELMAKNERLETRLQQLKTELDETRQREETLVSELAAKSAECETLESYLLSMLNSRCDKVCDVSVESCPALQGAVVLCVGGWGTLLQHYRSVVTKGGGEFLHHDGGKEHCVRRLPALLGQADFVICPLDAVSHNAYQMAKARCKSMAKPFTMMRQSGLSSFVRALHETAVSNSIQHISEEIN
jgi:hypothetical protein